MLRTLFPLVSVLFVASAHAASNEWLEGTVLADCEYCKTDAFREERRTIANQLGPKRDPKSGMGYVVTIDEDGRFVWGRAALLGTGNLIRTDAHVLFEDTGELKNADGKVYFESMIHGAASDLIEIDLSSVQRGGAVSPLVIDVKHDWAIARLREDAIEKFNGDRVFAFLWDFRITHDEISQPDYMRAAALVVSREHAFAIAESCRSAADDDPSRYGLVGQRACDLVAGRSLEPRRPDRGRRHQRARGRRRRARRREPLVRSAAGPRECAGAEPGVDDRLPARARQSRNRPAKTLALD